MGGCLMSNQAPKKRSAWPIACSFALFALASLLAGCNRAAKPQANQNNNKPEKPPFISVGVVRTQLLEKTINLPATVQSDLTAMLRPRVEAYVSKVLVDIGDEVQSGQLLIELNAPEYEDQARQARAMIQQLHDAMQVMQVELQAAYTQLEVGRAEYTLKVSERDRLARLVSSGAIDRQRLEEAESAAQSTLAMLAKYENAIEVVRAKLTEGESALKVQQAKLDHTETLAGYLAIKAPFSGVVARRDVDPGNLVRPTSHGSGDKSLLTIAKIDKLRAVVHATVDVAGQLSVGDKVRFAVDDMLGQSFDVEISRTAGTYDDKTRMMRAEIDLENALDPARGRRPLRAGTYGSATIVLQSVTLPVVPSTALRKSGQGVSVAVVRDGVFLVTPVEVAMEVDGIAGIASGVEAGEQVVVENPGAIKLEQPLSGSQVKVIQW